MKANVKTKQQQLSNKYSNCVVYLQVTIIHDGNCDKMIKHINCMHDLHLKLVSHTSHSVAVSIQLQETASQLTNELPVYIYKIIIVYNKVKVKNTDYQDHS